MASLVAKDEMLMRPVYGAVNETRASARYRWGCLDRGPRPFVILQWTHSGMGIFRCGRRERPVPTDHCFVALVPEDAEYRFDAGAREPWRFSWINFYDSLALRLWKHLRAEAGPVFALPPKSEAGTRLTGLLRASVGRVLGDRYEASIEGYAFFLSLVRQLRAPSITTPTRGRTRTVARDLAANGFFNTQLGIKAIAAEAGVSREHFSRIFKAEQGETPAVFLRRRRLLAADELLRTTGLPCAEIALRCGFSSARHFADAYRTSRGCSPQQTRTGHH